MLFLHHEALCGFSSHNALRMTGVMAKQEEAQESGGSLSVRWTDEEKKRIREGTKALHLKSATAFIRMAAMRLSDEVESGELKIRKQTDGS